MGYTLDPAGRVVLSNRRGDVVFNIDGGIFHTRLAIMAIVARVIHGAPESRA